MSINGSEEYLGVLAKKTFLSMWSYQNPYYSKGKELCDVLVIFENDVIVISDKFIKYDEKANADIGWGRWYKKAVKASVAQLNGAVKQIKRFPERIFSDASASSAFPLRVPDASEVRFHLIAVAHGCEEKGVALTIDSQCETGEEKFVVGTYYSGCDYFVHVFDGTALDAAFQCFDTVKDFVNYLTRKEFAVREGSYLINREEDFIASYMTSQLGDRDFFVPVDNFEMCNGRTVVPAGLWELYESSSLRKQRDIERQKSYMVDRFIEHIVDEYKSGNLTVGQEETFSYHEKHLRLMASESRLGRQVMSSALESVISETPQTFWCSTVQSKDVDGLMYLWLVYPIVPDSVTDDELESVLFMHLTEYMIAAQKKFSDAKMVFGVCLPNSASARTSMTFCVAGDMGWDDELMTFADSRQEQLGILDNIESFQILNRRL